jgi:hypothetical protein
MPLGSDMSGAVMGQGKACEAPTRHKPNAPFGGWRLEQVKHLAVFKFARFVFARIASH